LKVLIAEDESLLAWEMEEALSALGDPQIFWSPSLQGARQILSAHSDIALVLLDLKLQDGSGEELIDELTEKGIPLVIVTGYSPSKTGSFAVLIKPYPSEALISAVTAVLASLR
jgi:DNA-binding NtrC family response regulator